MFFGQTLHSPTEMRRLWTAAPSGGRDSAGQREESRLGIHLRDQAGQKQGGTSLTVHLLHPLSAQQLRRELRCGC